MTYEEMSIAELEEKNRRLMSERADAKFLDRSLLAGIREEQRRLWLVLDRKLAEERARIMAASDENLAQVVYGTGGIASGEKFGGTR